jgi:guanosine-3',5'-bis(diphosphate) 3'-pyrophosphohydrolase
MEEQILDLLKKEGLTKTELKNINKAFDIARENLLWVPRADGTTAYDHSLRVTLILMKQLKTVDYLSTVIAILHDVVEKSPALVIDIEAIFGGEIAGLIQQLSRDDSHKNENQQIESILKIRQNYKLNNAPHIVRLVKCADKIDNLKDLDEIPKGSKRYNSIPYWLIEAKTSILPIAEKTNREAYVRIKALLNRYEPMFPLPNTS